jgi:hypothetical protein
VAPTAYFKKLNNTKINKKGYGMANTLLAGPQKRGKDRIETIRRFKER